MHERGAVVAPKPSLNHQGTEEQQGGVDGWQRFAMFETWLPNPESLAPQLRLAGLPETVDVAVRKAFVAHYLTLPRVVENSAGWCKRLAKWAKQEITNSLGGKHAAGKTHRGSAPVGPSVAGNVTSTDWSANLVVQ